MQRIGKAIIGALAVVFIVLLASCSSSDTGQEDGTNVDESNGAIRIGTNNWVENIAVANMWKILLEERGYEVELVSVEKAVLYKGLSSKDLDLAVEIWLPETDSYYYEQYEDDLELGDIWYEGTELALTVPSYMEEINSIEDLNEYKDQFDSAIVGVESGASITMLTEDVIEQYSLDYELQASSEAAMMTELKSKMNNEEPALVTLWKPHSSFAELDLKTLEDSKNVYGDPEDIYYVTRKGFKEDYPEVTEWMNEFYLDDDQLGTLMASIEKSDSEMEGAQQWIDENKDLVDSWFP